MLAGFGRGWGPGGGDPDLTVVSCFEVPDVQSERAGGGLAGGGGDGSGLAADQVGRRDCGPGGGLQDESDTQVTHGLTGGGRGRGFDVLGAPPGMLRNVKNRVRALPGGPRRGGLPIDAPDREGSPPAHHRVPALSARSTDATEHKLRAPELRATDPLAGDPVGDQLTRNDRIFGAYLVDDGERVKRREIAV